MKPKWKLQPPEFSQSNIAARKQAFWGGFSVFGSKELTVKSKLPRLKSAKSRFGQW
jgi:hypothetical protein